MLSIFTEIAGKLLASKLPAHSQTVKELVTSKTNGLATIVVGIGSTMLMEDPSAIMGHVYVLAGLFAWTLKDAVHKTK